MGEVVDLGKARKKRAARKGVASPPVTVVVASSSNVKVKITRCPYCAPDEPCAHHVGVDS